MGFHSPATVQLLCRTVGERRDGREGLALACLVGGGRKYEFLDYALFSVKTNAQCVVCVPQHQH